MEREEHNIVGWIARDVRKWWKPDD